MLELPEWNLAVNTIVVALWLFALTHIDTLLVLIAFSVDEEYHRREILVGHYLGFTIGLAAAVVGAMAAAEALEGRTHLLGLLPLTLGLWSLLRRRPPRERDRPAVADGPLGRIGVVTSAGIGLSGENLALFLPFFAGLAPVPLGLVVLGYLVAAGVVYLVAVWLAGATSSVGIPDWIERWLVPLVLVTVGIYVLVAGIVVG